MKSMPYLVFSCQAANKVYFNDNPFGFNSQIQSKGYFDWVNSPEGCLSIREVARNAPGCGMLYDRAFGVLHAGYYIGEYADQPGRKLYCNPVLPGMTYEGSKVSFEDVVNSIGNLDKRIAWVGAFVGSPKMITESSSLNTPLDKSIEASKTLSYLVEMFKKNIVPIFDTGGTVDSSSDAYAIFALLKKFGVQFLLEPARPLGEDAEKVISTAYGLVSLYDVYNAIVLDKKRQWSNDEWLNTKGQCGVMWCSGGEPAVNFQRALQRLQSGGRVIVSLRGLTVEQITELHKAREAIEGSFKDEVSNDTAEANQVDATKVDATTFDKNKFKLK
jgi:hypothetical protein